MLTKTILDLSDIIVFDSPCTVHRDAANKLLGERGRTGIIIGKSDEIKDYRVYIPRDKVVVVTQHVKNVETLSEEQNDQLRRVHFTDKQPQKNSVEVKSEHAKKYLDTRASSHKVSGYPRCCLGREGTERGGPGG